MANLTNRLGRRSIALIWLAVAAVAIGSLIYFEQIAILYVIATLSIVLLLLVVAFADLENVGHSAMDDPAGQ